MLNIFLFVVVVLLVASVQANTESFSQRRRRTKELEEKISKLDDGTKQRIFAMKASGMPHDAIADKITYQAGGKTTAKRIVDAMLDESTRKTKKTTTPPPKQTATKTNTKTNANQKKTGRK